MYTIYHNTRCKVSRAVLELLIQTGQPVEIIDYMSKKITRPELEKLLIELQMRPFDLVRTQEELYKKEYKGKTFSNEEWVHILCNNSKLIERPIVKKGYQARLCRPAEIVNELIGK
jgi:arsenate reductase (glutaredoxin)